MMKPSQPIGRLWYPWSFLVAFPSITLTEACAFWPLKRWTKPLGQMTTGFGLKRFASRPGLLQGPPGRGKVPPESPQAIIHPNVPNFSGQLAARGAKTT